MVRLSISLLGPPTVKIDGVALALETRKTTALLTYLAVTGKIQRRDALVLLLWPELGQSEGRTVLRQTLYSLNKALAGGWIESDRETIGLRESPELWVDVREFRSLLQACKNHGHSQAEVCRDCRQPLTSAVSLYQNEFLQSFSLRDKVNFDDWQFLEAENLRRELISALERLIECLSAESEYAEAITYARRWLNLDPLYETAHCRLMQLFSWAGQRTSALRQYQDCLRILRAELDTEPLDTTKELYEEIKAGRIPSVPEYWQGEKTVEKESPSGEEAIRSNPETAIRKAAPRKGTARFRRAQAVAAEAFVGREKELSQLSSALDRAIQGSGSTALITGEPGIGKSRLAEELEVAAAAEGALVYWGRCYGEAGAPAYWPWVQILRGLVRDCDEECLAIDGGLRASVVMSIVPEIRERLPDLDQPLAVGDAESARFRLFDSINLLLQEATTKQPVVVVLDDLQWCDEPSLLLLELIAQNAHRARLLVVGTYRDTDVVRKHRLSKSLTELGRTSGFLRVRLRGLIESEVGSLLMDRSEQKPSAALVEDVYTLTDGSPFFIRELSELLSRHVSGEIQHLHQRELRSIGIPEGIRDVVGRRLDQLSEECNQLVRRAAVVGVEFSYSVLQQVMVEEDELLSQVEEALDTKMLLEDEKNDTLRFSHSLIRETLLGELSVRRRVREHARIAEALERLYGENAMDHAAELVEHVVQAEAVVGEEKAVSYCLSAGEEALDRFAYENAQEYFRQGLEIKNEEDRQTAELHFGLGKARARPGLDIFTPHKTESIERAFAIYERLEDREAMVRVASFPMGVLISTSMAEKALQYATPGSVDEAQLLVQNGISSYHRTGDYQTSTDQFRRALDIAEKSEDKSNQLHVLTQWAWLEWAAFRHTDAIRRAQRVIEFASDVNDRYQRMEAQFLYAYMVHVIDARDAIAQYGIALDRAVELKDRRLEVKAIQYLAELYTYIGEWETVREFLDRGDAIDSNDPVLISLRIFIELQVGNVDEAASLFSRISDRLREVPSGYLAEFVSYSLPGCDPDQCISARRVSLSESRMDKAKTPKLLDLMRLEALTGNPEAAMGYYSQMMPYWQNMFPDAYFYSGFANRVAGNFDVAIEHFPIAADFYRNCGRVIYLPKTFYELALALLERNSPGDTQKAIELLEEGLEITQRLGMKPLYEKLNSVRLGIETA